MNAKGSQKGYEDLKGSIEQKDSGARMMRIGLSDASQAILRRFEQGLQELEERRASATKPLEKQVAVKMHVSEAKKKKRVHAEK